MKAFIIFRDRVSYAMRCYAALQAAGFDITVVDHDSAWPAALLWLKVLEDELGGKVLRRGENAWPWQLWEWGPFRDLMDGDPEPYLVTDPDVVPSEDCPADWPDHLTGLLDRYPNCVKIGMGLRIDRLPASRHEGVTGWEGSLWLPENSPEPGVHNASVDTTLALYRPFTDYPVFALAPAVRTGHPYVADHYGWYEEEGKLSPELEFYHSRADPGHGVISRLFRD